MASRPPNCKVPDTTVREGHMRRPASVKRWANPCLKASSHPSTCQTGLRPTYQELSSTQSQDIPPCKPKQRTEPSEAWSSPPPRNVFQPKSQTPPPRESLHTTKKRRRRGVAGCPHGTAPRHRTDWSTPTALNRTIALPFQNSVANCTHGLSLGTGVGRFSRRLVHLSAIPRAGVVEGMT